MTLKIHCRKFLALFSDNDPLVHLKHAAVFKRELSAEITVEHGLGHFDMDGKRVLDVVLESLLRMSGNKG